MSLTSPSTAPPGWFPDPGGAPQWRVWTGTNWSELTRPYPTAAPLVPLAAKLPLIGALHRLVRYGVGAVFAALALVVGVLGHWPGTANPTPLWFAVTAASAGVGLLVIGTVCFTFAVRELAGRWTVAAFVPGVNVMVASSLVARRLGTRSSVQRVVAETVLLALFLAQAHAQPWLVVAPVLVAFNHMTSTSTLVDQLAGPSLTAPPIAP